MGKKGLLQESAIFEPEEIILKIQWKNWFNDLINNLSKKITLKVPTETELLEIASKANELKLPVFLVKDAVLTQIPSNTYTACAIGPAPSKLVNPIIKHLNPL